ncbi:hypothetical protein ACI2KV_25320 [Micromonospora chokoriensis]
MASRPERLLREGRMPLSASFLELFFDLAFVASSRLREVDDQSTARPAGEIKHGGEASSTASRASPRAE